MKKIISLVLLVMGIHVMCYADDDDNNNGGRSGPHSCSIQTRRTMDFGIYDPFSHQDNRSTGRLRVRCFGRGRMSVELSLSAGNSNQFNQRYMLNTNDGLTRLYYNVYLNSSRTQIWGDGTGSSQVYTRSRNNNFTINKTVYGKIPARQTNLKTGIYQDTLIATLEF